MVTLVGPGGAGKTRLLREVVPAPVILAGVRDADLLRSTVAAAVGAGPEPDALAAALRHRGPWVLGLDNLEQLGPTGARFVSALASAAPELTIAATSRARLEVEGERVVPVEPLPEPDALALLRERLARRAPGRTFDGEGLVALVRELDALPLAIELAAARVPALGVAAVRAHLGRRLDWLSDRGPDRPDHHRSLRNAVSGSWDLLGPAARAAARRIALLPDPLALSDLAGFPDADLPLHLAALVDASLVRVDDTGAEPRYHLYEAVRAFALEQVPVDDPLWDEVTAALVRSAEPALQALGGPGVGPAVDQLLRCRSALLAAAERAEALGRADDHARLALLLDRVLHQHGPAAWRERHLARVRAELPATDPRHVEATLSLVMTGSDLGPGALDFPGAALGPALEARRDTARAKLWYDAGRYAEAAELAAGVVERLGDREPRAAMGARWVLGGVCTSAGRLAEARAAFDDGLRIARAVGSPLDEALFLGQLGSVLLDLGDDGAVPSLLAAIALLERHRDARRSVWTMRLAEVHVDGGRVDAALDTADRALASIRGAGQRRFEGYALAIRARALEAAGRVDEALATFAAARDAGGHPLLVGTLECWYGRALADAGRADEAGAALGRARYPDGSKLVPLVALCAAHLNLLRARALEGAGADPEPLRAEVQAVLAATEPAAHEVRAARHRLAESLARDRGPDGVVTAADGSWLQVGAARTELGTRHAIRRVWLALVGAHPAGEELGVDALFAAGWPGEDAHPDAARDRVYHAIATLRRGGLEGILDRSGRGWRLRPGVPLRTR